VTERSKVSDAAAADDGAGPVKVSHVSTQLPCLSVRPLHNMLGRQAVYANIKQTAKRTWCSIDACDFCSALLLC